jgi:hypothetical protein
MRLALRPHKPGAGGKARFQDWIIVSPSSIIFCRYPHCAYPRVQDQARRNNHAEKAAFAGSRVYANFGWEQMRLVRPLTPTPLITRRAATNGLDFCFGSQADMTSGPTHWGASGCSPEGALLPAELRTAALTHARITLRVSFMELLETLSRCLSSHPLVAGKGAEADISKRSADVPV